MITYDIDLCIGMDNQGSAITVKCCDTGVNIRAHLYVCRHSKWRDKHEPYRIPEGCTAVIKIAKPDKTYFVKDGKVDGGAILFRTKPQAFTAAGIAEAEVSLFNQAGDRITTASFSISIPSECTSKCDGESEDYVDVMAEQIQAAIDAADRAEEAAERAEEAGGGTGDADVEDGGYYIPHTSQDTAGTMTISFTASKEGMEPVPDQTIPLPAGERGPQGPQGNPGADGKDGKDGEKGDKGDTGSQGSPGKDGKDGVSATHSWNGTILTVTSASGTSSADLKGAPGKDGQNGNDGAPGKDGYTPKKGVDYYTETDKAEMVNAVLAALPNGDEVSY